MTVVVCYLLLIQALDVGHVRLQVCVCGVTLASLFLQRGVALPQLGQFATHLEHVFHIGQAACEPFRQAEWY